MADKSRITIYFGIIEFVGIISQPGEARCKLFSAKTHYLSYHERAYLAPVMRAVPLIPFIPFIPLIPFILPHLIIPKI
jgi:hypothetical protein